MFARLSMPQADAQTASCKNGETTSFGTISYTSTDANESYYYKISERAGAIAGMAYSTDKYAKVSVGEVDGVLSAVVTYGDTQAACDAADAATSLTVTNTYTRSFEVSFVKTDARNTFKFLRNCKLQVTSDDGVTAYGDAWYSDPAAPHKIMYSWASFSVALTAVFACRIALATSRAADEKSVAAPGGGEVPAGWWVVLFGASLASAYLHYYAAIAAFLVNVFLLVVLLRYRGTCKRRIRTFLCGAVVTVACYLPWVMALAGQVSHVSGGFWIEMSFPGTAYDILDYLVLTPAMLEAVGGSCGNVLQALATIVSVAVAVCAAALSGWMVVQLWRHGTSRRRSASYSPFFIWESGTSSWDPRCRRS